METSSQGLSEAEVQQRIRLYGFNRLRPHKKSDALTLLLGQFKSPIILILIFAAGLSLFLGDRIDALIILGIVLVSGFLGFWQEHSAADAVKKLLSIVQVKAQVLRSGSAREIPVEEVVPGDGIRTGGPTLWLSPDGDNFAAGHRGFRHQCLFCPAGYGIFFFSLALAVGLTPQLLPAIISINLAHGAKQMARQKVIVKRLAPSKILGV